MALPSPPFRPNNPIPNSPFYYPETFFLQGTVGPIVVGSGLSVDYATSTLNAGGTGAVTSVTGSTGISVSPTTGNVVVTNTGVTQLSPGPGITLSGSTGNVTISAAGGSGTVTNIATGTGLTGGPITTTGTIALANTAVTPASYTYASFTVDAQGRLTAASSGTAPVTAVTGTLPISVTAGATPVVSVAAASTSGAGVVQLVDNTASTSTTQALTAAQGKNLQDQINALSVSSNLTLAGTFDASTGLVDSVTTAGTIAGFAVGSALPAAALANADYFVIVDVGGSTGPSGTPPYHIGDWFLSNGSAWVFLNVGYQAPYASTTVPGIVELATNAETQTGTDATLAVTPASLQSKLSDSTSTTSSTTIASSTAVKAAYDLAAAAIPCSAYTAKAVLLAGSAASTPTALTVGTNGQVLTACSTCTTGMYWAPVSVACASATVDGIMKGCTNNAGCNVGLGCGVFGSIIVGGLRNTSVGFCSGYLMTGGCDNSLFGAQAGRNIFGGNQNTAIGSLAGCGLTSGLCNIIIGACSALSIQGGCCNILIGTGITGPVTGTTNCFAIGHAASRWITGDSTYAIKPGAGIIDCAGSCGTNGQVLMSNGSNAVCWATPGGASPATPTVQGILYGCNDNANYNTYLGYSAGALITSNCNTAIGYCAAASSTGSSYDSVYVGSFSGYQGALSTRNTYVGARTGCNALNTGTGNTFVGFAAGCLIQLGDRNVAIGCRAGSLNANGDYNVEIGAFTSSLDGSCNVLIGTNLCGPSGFSNIFIGSLTGHLSCACNISGNVAIGCGVELEDNSGCNQLAIGFSSSDYWLTGRSDSAIKPGAGIIDCTNSCGLSGQVLMSNGSNAICWGTPAGASQATPTTLGTVCGCTDATNAALGSQAFLTGAGTSNVALGTNALSQTSSGAIQNVAIGASTMLANVGGFSNTAVGQGSLVANVSGNANTALGLSSLPGVTGSCNTGVGSTAGCNITSGCFNVAIGPYTQVADGTCSCQLAIGFSDTCNWLTGDCTKAIKPGAGIMDCASSCGTAGQVIQSTGANGIVWATPAPGYNGYNGYKSSVTSGTKFNVTGYLGELGYNVGGQLNIFTTYGASGGPYLPGSNVLIFLNGLNGVGTSTIQAFNTSTGTFLVESVLYPAYTDITVTFTPSVTTDQMNFYIRFLDAIGNGGPGNGNFFSPFLTIF